MFGGLLTLLYLLKLIIPLYAECHIFLLTKCPPPSTEQEYARDPNGYCRGVKANVDCVNEKLKECSYIDDYLQAMQTLKLIYQFTVQQATNHGCEDIEDKIILPGDESLKPKPSTTTVVPEISETSTIEPDNPIEKKGSISLDPECLRNLTSIDCEKLNPPVLKYLLDDTNIDSDSCSKIINYTDCVQEKFAGDCLLKFNKTVSRLRSINQSCNMKIMDETNKAADKRVKKDLVLLYLASALFSLFFLKL